MTDKFFHEEYGDEILSAYVDGELTDAERATVEKRLQADPQAREMVAQLRAVSESLRSLPKHRLEVDLREAVLQHSAVRAERVPAEAGGPRRWAWAALALAAALMLMVFLPETDRDDQRVAQAPSKERQAERLGSELQDSAKQEVLALSLPQDSSSSVAADILHNRGGFRQDADQNAEADSLALGATFGGTLKMAPIEPPYLQPIGEVRDADFLVHLSPINQSVGAAQFDQLLEQHGIVLRGEPSASPDQDERQRKLGASTSDVNETDLVLVVAPLEQIQQIVAACGKDDSQWKSFRLVDQEGAEVDLLSFTRQNVWARMPEEKGVAVALENLSLSDSQDRGWAKHLGRNRITAGEPSSSESETSVEVPVTTLRVLFFLHPAKE